MEPPTPHSRKYIAILAGAACLILSVGWLIRPREVSNLPAPLPAENELAQLARRAERRTLDSMTTYFSVTAGDAESSIVRLPDTGASGVAWKAGLIVTAPLPRHSGGTLAIQSASGEDNLAQATIWGPRLPLAAIAPGRALTGVRPMRRAESSPNAGSWVLAVWRTEEGRGFAPGVYVQSASSTCGSAPVQEMVSSLVLNPIMSGGGLFDIDANLLAVILPCGDRLAAIAAPSIDSILAASGTDAQRLLAQYGVVLGSLTDAEQSHLKADSGVIVREVWTGHPGDEAGLIPGDIISALNDGPVATPADLMPLTRPAGDAALNLTVRRGSRTLTIALSGADAAPDAPAGGAGLVWQSPPEGYAIDVVVPGSRAANAGIESGDRVLRIDYATPRSLAQVQRAFAGGQTALIEIARGDRRLATLLQ